MERSEDPTVYTLSRLSALKAQLRALEATINHNCEVADQLRSEIRMEER